MEDNKLKTMIFIIISVILVIIGVALIKTSGKKSDTPKTTRTTTLKSIHKLTNENVVLETNDDLDEKYKLNTSIESTDESEEFVSEKYLINVVDENNDVVKLENKTFTLTITLDDKLKNLTEYQVNYLAENNEVKNIDITLNEDSVIFTTETLGTFNIVGKKEVITTTTTSQTTTTTTTRRTTTTTKKPTTTTTASTTTTEPAPTPEPTQAPPTTEAPTESTTTTTEAPTTTSNSDSNEDNEAE